MTNSVIVTGESGGKKKNNAALYKTSGGFDLFPTCDKKMKKAV
jgi:hypothetical protein